MRGKFWAALTAMAFCVAGAAHAQERSAIKPGFTFPTDRQATIVVFRPEVQVGTLTAGGVDEPNADWTGAARDLIEQAMRRNEKVSGAKINFVADPEGDDGAYLADYRALFRAVSQSIQIHKLFVGQRLPTKRETFDWTLGTGTERIAQMTGADYALFLYTHDAYGSAGRKTAQIFGAMLGVAVIPGVHIGYAGLVDLHSGEVIWFNADPQMGGDVRTAEGADKRVGQLLDGFPGRVVPTAALTTATK
jgi:hypothetical protein